MLSSIPIAILFSIRIRILFLHIGPVVSQKTHTGPITFCLSSLFDLSGQFRKKLNRLRESVTLPPVLSTSYQSCGGHHYPFLEKISTYPFLNTIPHIHSLKLKFRWSYPFRYSSKSFRGTCTQIATLQKR